MSRHRTIVSILAAAGVFAAALAFAALPPPITVNVLPTTFPATTSQAVIFAFRQAFFDQFYQDALALDSWSGPSGTVGFSMIDPNPNVAITKLVAFLAILRQNGSGMYDLLAERHDNTMNKIGQAFVYAKGSVQGAADYTMETQGVSRYLSTDTNPANNQAAGIDAVAFLQVYWCDVAPSIAYAAYLKVGPQMVAAGLVQQAFPCPVPGTTPTPTPTPIGPTPTATPTPPPGSTPTPTPIPGVYTLTISCQPPLNCAPVVVNVPANGLTLTLAPK